MGLDYTPIGRMRRKGHHNFSSELMARDKFRPQAGGLADLAAAAKGDARPLIVLSSEMFEGCETPQVERLREILAPVGRPFRIIMVIRDMLDLIPSSYAQKVRHGHNTFDFDSFFENRMLETRVDVFETARRWAEVFGWDSLRVRSLDPGRLANADLIDDFLITAGFAGDASALLRPGRVNVASGWKTLEAVRALHLGRHGLADDHPLVAYLAARREADAKFLEKASQLAGDAIGWSREKSVYFTRAQAERVLATDTAAIASLNRHLPEPLPLPASLADRNFEERKWLPEASRIPPPEIASFHEAVTRTLLTKKRTTMLEAMARSWAGIGPSAGAACLLKSASAGARKATLLIETDDFRSRTDADALASRLLKVTGDEKLSITFTPPRFLTRAGDRVDRAASAAQWRTVRRGQRRRGRRARDGPLKILAIGDARLFRAVDDGFAMDLSRRIGAPIRFEPACLPPLAILLSDAVFLDYFLPRMTDAEPFAAVATAIARVRDADAVIIDDATELLHPLKQVYPVLSHRLERSADADLLAFRGQAYLSRHDRVPAAVVNGADFPLSGRQRVIDAFSDYLDAPVFRVAAMQAAAAHTLDWDYRPLHGRDQGPGPGPLDGAELASVLGDWLGRQMAEARIRRPAGEPATVSAPGLEPRRFDCAAIDRAGAERVIDSFDRFCIAGPDASAPFLDRAIAERGKRRFAVADQAPESLAAAGDFDCLLCRGSSGPAPAERPAVALMSAGWSSPSLNLPASINPPRRRGRIASSNPDNWYHPP